MSKVSYFQRFSQRENHVTNNTLLVLRYLYQSSPLKLQQVLSSFLDDELEIGLSFEQQVRKSVSVPDAVIEQKPFRIVIETKLGNGLDHGQIRRHVTSMQADPIGSHFRSILIGLTPGAVTDAAEAELRDFAQQHGVQFVAVTFEDLLVALREACAEHEVGLLAIIEDWRGSPYSGGSSAARPVRRARLSPRFAPLAAPGAPARKSARVASGSDAITWAA